MRHFLIGALIVATAIRSSLAQNSADFSDAFHEIHRTVAEQFLDPTLGGLDWKAIGVAYGNRVETCHSLDAFAVIVNDMLSLLKTSHTEFITSREPAYFQLLSIFHGPLETKIRQAHPENVELQYPGIGIFTREIDGQTFVSGVLNGGPADKAGLRVGDRIVSVNESPFQPIGSFENRVGMDTPITIQRKAGAGETSIVVRPAMINPNDVFIEAMKNSVRLIGHDQKKIGYIRIWSYAGEQYQDLLKDEITGGTLKDADALILDLRDGWGGANPEYLNLFNTRVPVMTQINRDKQQRTIDSQWRRPVALLVNGGTRSGKEIIAYGFRQYKIGPVIGERTAGAVVGGRPFLIRPGMLLYLAVSGVRVNGERLEGHGVEPDVPVPFDIRYCNGADVQLDAAVKAAADAAPLRPKSQQ